MSNQAALDEFRKLCENHDVTYDYSDDHRVWSNGWAEYNLILVKAKQLPKQDAIDIWNETMQKRFFFSPEYVWSDKSV